MRLIVIIFIFICFQQLASGKTPRWVNDPASACKKSELCAVGEGVNRTRAKTAARLAIGKIFKTQVKAKFSETVSSSNGGAADEQMSDEVEEITDAELEGVEIKKVYETDVGFYALASLNKRKEANKVKKEIEQIDNKMREYAKSSKASAWMKLEPLYQKRENLNARHIFLSGFDISSPLSYAEIFKYKAKAAEKMQIFVSLKEAKPKQLEGILIQVLSDRGYKTLSGKNQKKRATHLVSGEYSYEKQHLNVDGFEKYKFLLNIKAQNRQSVESGALNTAVVTTGRSFQQAKERAIPQLQNYLIENIEKLNIE